MTVVPPVIAVFDLCDTLYAENTTLGFLRHFAETEHRGAVTRRIRRWTSRRSPFFYLGMAAHRLLGTDLARRRLIDALKGERKATLDRIAQSYVDMRLPVLANAPVHDMLDAHRRRGSRLVILSSSLDVVVAPIAKRLGMEYRASELAFEDDRCTGRLAHDLTGAKVAALGDLEQRPSRLFVVTDNPGDRALVELADDAIVVIPAGRRAGQWGGAGLEYLRL